MAFIHICLARVVTPCSLRDTLHLRAISSLTPSRPTVRSDLRWRVVLFLTLRAGSRFRPQLLRQQLALPLPPARSPHLRRL
eukprot:3925985-Alexandrium_andersonii.AAC.1